MTTATTTLTEFLIARIAEDEECAREAIPGAHSPNADAGGSWQMVEMDHEGIWPEPASEPIRWGLRSDEPWAIHVERHDPARVLAECEAKRRIAARHDSCVRDAPEGHCGDLRDLASVYADHPDYDEAWRP